MKKILMLSILAMLVFVVSACGGNNPAPVPQQQPTSPTTQTPPPTTNDTGTADNNAADVAAPFEVDPAVYAEGQRLWEEFCERATAMAADSNNDLFFMAFRAHLNRHGEWFEQFTNGEFADYEAKSYLERFLWTDTYLRMVEAIYNSTHIETADRFRQFTIGAQITAISRQCEDTAAAYEALMMWQYDYLMASHTVFNFITGVNHRASMGADFDPIAASTERAAAEQALIEQELQEIADEIDEP